MLIVTVIGRSVGAADWRRDGSSRFFISQLETSNVEVANSELIESADRLRQIEFNPLRRALYRALGSKSAIFRRSARLSARQSPPEGCQGRQGGWGKSGGLEFS